MTAALDVAQSHALQHLSNRYWAQADGKEPLALDALFTPDGILALGQMRLEGLPAITAFFADRAAQQQSSGRTTRHVATNFLACLDAPDRAHAQSTVMVYAGLGAHPIAVSHPTGIADFEDIILFDPLLGWRFASRVGRTVFIGEGAAAFAR